MMSIEIENNTESAKVFKEDQGVHYTEWQIVDQGDRHAVHDGQNILSSVSMFPQKPERVTEEFL